MKRTALSAVLLAVLLAACGGTPGAPAATTPAPTLGPPAKKELADALPFGAHRHQLPSKDGMRSFLTYRPADLADNAALVVVLHGYGGSGASAQAEFGWNRVADQHGFVVAYPDGLNNAFNSSRDCCSGPQGAHIDDVAFVNAVVKAVGDQVPIDTRRIYLTGFSNGAMMGYTTVCRSSTFAAIGAVAGTELEPCPNPHRTSVIAVHGIADSVVAYNGQYVRGPGGPTQPALHDRWRLINDCGPAKRSQAGLVTRSAADCADGRGVELVSIAGLGHTWPLDAPQASGHPTFDAARAIWAFFAAHPAPAG